MKIVAITSQKCVGSFGVWGVGSSPLKISSTATMGIAIRKKGARRPTRVQMRSLVAPTTGWISDCSNERVLLNQPIRMLFCVNCERYNERMNVLKAKYSPAANCPAL